jgi:hypothetical protein
LCHQRARLTGQGEFRVKLAGTVGEQDHRRGSSRPGGFRGGHRQRPQPVAGLPSKTRRLLAGRQHPYIISGRQQFRVQLRHRFEQVLTVVHYKQQLLAGQHADQRLHHRHARRLLSTQSSRHGLGQQRRLLDGSQLHQPHAVGELADYSASNFGGQPGLAHPARPGHCHQPIRTQQAGDLVRLPIPADETRQRRWETVAAPRSPAQGTLPHSAYHTGRYRERRGRTDARIYISVSTVRSHLDRIRHKSGCRRRADLTRLAL